MPRPNSKNDVVWAPRGTKVLPLKVDRHSAKLNVSAVISYNGKSRIDIFEESLNSNLYTKIITRTFVPFIRKQKKAGGTLFMDGDPKHTSKMTTLHFAKKAIATAVLPARSPDFNAIENVWSMLIDDIKKLEPKTKSEFRVAITKAWRRLSLESIQHCFDSLPNRLEEAIANGGDQTKY